MADSYTVVSRKRAHYGPLWIVRPRLKTYSKERLPNASIAKRDFPLSSKHQHVVRLVYTLQGANYAATQWFTLV